VYRPRAQHREQIGVAVVGAGYWGMNYVRILTELPGARVVVVSDSRRERLDEVHARFPTVPLTTDLDEALGLAGVEAAVVSTPATTHYALTRRVLEQRLHVLVEKPLTTTVPEADDLIALAAENGCTLSVGHTFVYNPGVRKLKEFADSGELGSLYYLYSRRTSLGPIRRDVNAIWDLATHDVSIFNYLLDGMPTSVSAVGAAVLDNARHDVGFLTLAYGDVLGHIHVSWADPHKVREVVLVASDKRVVFNDLDPIERVRVYDKGVMRLNEEPTSFGEFQFHLRDGDITSPQLPAAEPLKLTCMHFLDCMRRGEQPLSDGRAGREVVAVMEAIDCSIALNGAPVPVPVAGAEAPIREQLAVAAATLDGGSTDQRRRPADVPDRT
jgi:predicted dehydrogenase